MAIKPSRLTPQQAIEAQRSGGIMEVGTTKDDGADEHYAISRRVE